MTQTAMVTALTADGSALVKVFQKSACGHDCENCGVCGDRREITVLAKNPLRAVRGDLVTVETATGKLVGAAALVYALPLAMLLLGCIFGAAFGFGEGMQALLSVCGLALGSLAAILINRYVRRDRPLEYTIIDVGENLNPRQEQEA